MKIIAKNRKARFNYEILDQVEAGMVLRGWQVKSIKASNVSIAEGYAYIRSGEAYLRGITIGEWKGMGNSERVANEQGTNDIKLLMQKDQINRWEGKLKQKQATVIVPMMIYLERGLVKIEIGLARGMKKYDKRAKIKEREVKREISRDLKSDKYF